MINKKLRLHLYLGIFIVVTIGMGMPCFALSPGQSCPAFTLPTLDGRHQMSSDSLFKAHPYIVLLFFNGECPECREFLGMCGSLSDSLQKTGAAIVAINYLSDVMKVRNLIEQAGLEFPVLHDGGGVISKQYGCLNYAFSYLICNTEGKLLFISNDKPKTPQKVLQDVKELAKPTSPGPLAVPRPSPWRISGQGILRLQHISSDDDIIYGPFGEDLAKGTYLVSRLLLNVERSISNNFSAGALARISNEDARVLQRGPYYLSNPWGSFYAAFRSRYFQARAGYYATHFSPLTLMRWDLNDTPREGGQGNCAVCGASSGSILSQGLETMEPDLHLEGIKLNGNFKSLVGAEIIYGRLLPSEEKGALCDSILPPGPFCKTFYDFRFQRDLLGLRIHSRLPVPWHANPFDFSLNGVIIKDDMNNPPMATQEAKALDNRIVSLEIGLPLIMSLALHGEGALSYTNRNQLDSTAELVRDYGGIAGLKASSGKFIKAKAAGFYLGQNFTSSLGALTYFSNNYGFRGSCDIHLKRIDASLFLKKTFRDKPDPDAVVDTACPTPDRESLILSASCKVQIVGPLAFRLGAIQQEHMLDKPRCIIQMAFPDLEDNRSLNLFGGFEITPAPQALLLLTLRQIQFKNRPNPDLDYKVLMPEIWLQVDF